MQKEGKDYGAKEISWYMDENLCEITMDIAGAYPAEARLMTYQRTAILYKKSSRLDCEIRFADSDKRSKSEYPDSFPDKKSERIVIKDHFSLRESVPVILTLMTCEKPVPQTLAQGLLLQIGDLGNITLSQCQLIAIEEIPITDPRLQTAWIHNLYRILIKPDCPELEISIQ